MSETTTGVVYRLDLPFTRPPLLENGRYHWAVKARETAQLRRDAAILARAVHLPRNLPRATVTLHWQPGSRRGRDTNGPSPTLKALIDGVVTDYGLAPDDTAAHIVPACCIHDWQRGVPAACWLTITPTGGANP